jgi:hypothetical protein
MPKAQEKIRHAITKWCLENADRLTVSNYVDVKHIAPGGCDQDCIAELRCYMHRTNWNGTLRYTIANISVATSVSTDGYIHGDAERLKEAVRRGNRGYIDFVVQTLKEQDPCPDVIEIELLTVRKIRDRLLSEGWKHKQHQGLIDGPPDHWFDQQGYPDYCAGVTLYIDSSQF